MITVNSLSGGPTSSYLGVHYPADFNLFSLVCVDDTKCAHPDKKIMQYVNDKIGKFCPQWGEVIGTAEDPIIFETMIRLEQFMGTEIIWLRGMSFDDLIEEKGMLPNKRTRFCTTIMKLQAIFEFCLKYIEMDIHKMNINKFKQQQNFWCKEPIRMRLGYRYDEKERADDFSKEFNLPLQSRFYGEQKQITSTFYNWRKGDHVLIRDKIVNPRINKFWIDKDIPFAEDTNCQMCFWKPWQQKRKNWDVNKPQMNWGASKEIKNKFDDKFTLEQIKRMPLQTDFFYGVGAGCQAGVCTP